jgi:hypothetical protein
MWIATVYVNNNRFQKLAIYISKRPEWSPERCLDINLGQIFSEFQSLYLINNLEYFLFSNLNIYYRQGQKIRGVTIPPMITHIIISQSTISLHHHQFSHHKSTISTSSYHHIHIIKQ